jgi:hypothetical protein
MTFEQLTRNAFGQTAEMQSIAYATPSTLYVRPRSRLARACLQVAHRSLSLALILLVIGVAATAAGKTAAPLLLWAFAAGDLAVLAAFVALASDRRRGHDGEEALVATWLSASAAVVSLLLYFVFRLSGA